MVTVFKKEKIYPDGEKLILKGSSINPLTVDTRKRSIKAVATRRRNLALLSYQQKQGTSYNFSMFDSENMVNRLAELKNVVHINPDNVRRCAQRARDSLYDICRCNTFDYFVTLTFDKEKIDRYNDNAVRSAFTRWSYYSRRFLPNMYYVSVPERHKKGQLHFHLLVGGVSSEELGLIHAVNKKTGMLMYTTKGKHRGNPIYNVTGWQYGWSTATKIIEQNATKHYICKYITKQSYDLFFYNKKRYYVSRNIHRPDIIREIFTDSTVWCIDFDKYDIEYFSLHKQYGVFVSRAPRPSRVRFLAPGYTIHQALPLYNPFDRQTLKRGYITQTMRKSLLDELAYPERYCKLPPKKEDYIIPSDYDDSVQRGIEFGRRLVSNGEPLLFYSDSDLASLSDIF